MKVNLRKASALQHELSALLVQESTQVSKSVSVDVTPHQLARTVKEAAQNKVLDGLDNIDRLNSAITDIRTGVGIANYSQTQVGNMLAELAEVDRGIKALKFLDNLPEVKQDGEIESWQNSSREGKTSSFYSDHITTGVLSDEDVATLGNQVRELKKRKRELKDSLLEENIKGEVLLSVETTATLKAFGLI